MCSRAKRRQRREGGKGRAQGRRRPTGAAVEVGLGDDGRGGGVGGGGQSHLHRGLMNSRLLQLGGAAPAGTARRQRRQACSEAAGEVGNSRAGPGLGNPRLKQGGTDAARSGCTTSNSARQIKRRFRSSGGQRKEERGNASKRVQQHT